PHPTSNAHDLPLDDYLESLHLHATTLSPWHAWLDPTPYNHYLDHLTSMELTALTTAHGPTVTGSRIPRVFDTIRKP
ncbi:hypothetical protein, partial [Acrocarpospora macrocephala]